MLNTIAVLAISLSVVVTGVTVIISSDYYEDVYGRVLGIALVLSGFGAATLNIIGFAGSLI